MLCEHLECGKNDTPILRKVRIVLEEPESLTRAFEEAQIIDIAERYTKDM